MAVWADWDTDTGAIDAPKPVLQLAKELIALLPPQDLQP
jgi:hypothetical protein